MDGGLAPLVRVQQSVTRLIRNLKRQDPVLLPHSGASLATASLLNYIQVMPAEFMASTTVQGSKYMKELVTPGSSLAGRERLRSASTMNYDIERTKLKFGERSFAASGPTAWNTLPAKGKCIGNIVSFKRHLKTHLSSIAYTCEQ